MSFSLYPFFVLVFFLFPYLSSPLHLFPPLFPSPSNFLFFFFSLPFPFFSLSVLFQYFSFSSILLPFSLFPLFYLHFQFSASNNLLLLIFQGSISLILVPPLHIWLMFYYISITRSFSKNKLSFKKKSSYCNHSCIICNFNFWLQNLEKLYNTHQLLGIYSVPGSNGNEGVLYTPKCSKTWALSPDAGEGHTESTPFWWGLTPLQRYSVGIF